jgi:uncharacterized protein YjdB
MIIELILMTAVTGSIIDDYSSDKVRAEAATLMDAIGQYVINIGSEYYRQSDEIVIDRNSTVQLMYVDATGNVLPIAIDAGTTLEIEWNVLDDGGEVSSTVITANGVSKNISGLKNYCEVKVVGIGYTNLTARITMTDNVEGITSFIDYSWKIKVSLAIDNENATDDSAYDGGDYGLRYAFSTDKSKDTLQISGPEVLTDADPDNDKYNSYLLLLKKANLLYKVDEGGTERFLDNFSTEADIELNTDLATLLNDNIIWTTSDSTVATVKYGVIRGVGAGQCVITATAESSDGRSRESVSVTVVVKPTGYVEGSSAGYQSSFVEIVDDNSFTIDTNAIDATQLVWTVHNIDINGDILWSNTGSQKTDKFHVTLYNTGGRIYFSGVEAGAYYITAQVKGDYGESNTKIRKMGCTIIVPVKLPEGPLYINVSDTYNIVENSSIKDYKWYDYVSDDDAIASVHNGIITGEGSGETTIHLTRVTGAGYEDVYTPDEINAYVPATLDIIVRVVDTISLNYASYVMYVGGELKLRATTTSPTVVTWTSSDESVATVDNGTVKALAVGTTVITASQSVEGVEKTAKCKITVREAVKDIVLIPETAQLNIGDNLTVNAQVHPSLNGVSLSWNSSDESVVKITSYDDLSCTVYAAGGGKATLTAVNPENEIVGYCQITVYAPITKITLSQTSVSLPLSAGWFQLYAEIEPPSAINNEIVWTSMDTSVATVDQNGIVTLKKPGSTSILVSSKNDASVFAVCNLEVTKTVSGIKLDTTTHDMYVGDTYRLTYTISPAGATESAVTWQSSNTSVATVDANGLVTAKGVGSAVIICKTKDGGYTATCTINVGRVATGLKLDVTKLTLNTGDYYYLQYTLTPADTTEGKVTFASSDNAVATVSANGKITAKSAGTCVIAAQTGNGTTTYVAVTVNQSTNGLKISERALEIKVGEMHEMDVTFDPTTASNQNYTWNSSRPDVATIDKKGYIKGIAGGVTVITCTSEEGGFIDYCIVTVIEQVTDVVLSDHTYKLGLNRTYRLTATISGETATNKDVTWRSSNPEVCTVDENGRIRGISLGDATIYCTAADGSGAEDLCEVTVCELVKKIDLDITYITLIQGHSYTITAKVSDDNATFKEVIWTSDDEKIAIVNPNGVVTALNPGSTVVRASANDTSGVSAICYINVIAPVYTTAIKFAESELVLIPGEERTVQYALVPNNTTETVSWSSDNTIVATVDQNTGHIVAKSVGTANVSIMTETGLKGTIKVYVLGLSRTYVELQQYTSLLIPLTVDGLGATGVTVRWDVDNQEIAEVSNGSIIAKKLGYTKIYAVVNGRRLECTVHVIKIK